MSACLLPVIIKKANCEYLVMSVTSLQPFTKLFNCTVGRFVVLLEDLHLSALVPPEKFTDVGKVCTAIPNNFMGS